MVKKMILCCILSALMLSGCTTAPVVPAETCPGHTPASSGWNEKEHWDECACGARLNVQEHIMGLKNRCVVCDIIVEHHESGEITIRELDEHGNAIYTIVYLRDGEIFSEAWTEYALDSEGNYYPCSYHSVDPSGETWTEYEPKQPGSDSIEDWHTTLFLHKYDDGRTHREEFDANGNMVLQEIFEPKEKLTTSTYWEFDDEGRELWQKEYRNEKLIREITDYIEWEDPSTDYTFRRPEFEINYQTDGTQMVTYYTYFDDGFEKSASVYDGDRLVLEKKYEALPYTWPYLATETEYHADGTKTVIEYDENGDAISEITYDTNGNVIE